MRFHLEAWGLCKTVNCVEFCVRWIPLSPTWQKHGNYCPCWWHSFWEKCPFCKYKIQGTVWCNLRLYSSYTSLKLSYIRSPQHTTTNMWKVTLPTATCYAPQWYQQWYQVFDVVSETLHTLIRPDCQKCLLTMWKSKETPFVKMRLSDMINTSVVERIWLLGERPGCLFI